MKGKTNSGFTLLEVVIAVSILAIGVVALMGVFSSGLNTAVRMEQDRRGIESAREVMNGILADKDLKPGKLSGVTPEGHKWEAFIEKYKDGMEDSVKTTENNSLLSVKLVMKWEAIVGEGKFELNALYNRSRER